jgi:23S rRNA pseudouridine2605 synthase
MERLQKILSESGVCSRREAERLIAAGRVKVDGVVAVIGQSADAKKHKITLDGQRINEKAKHVYILLNKPRGYVCSAKDELGRKTVLDLLSGCEERVYPVGRLDMLSDGFLLLTNDGEFALRMTHPKFEAAKHYRVRIKGEAANLENAAKRLSEPLTVRGVTYSGANTRVLEQDDVAKTALLELTLFEGKNREIRKMCEALNLEVLRLSRVGEGKLRLGGLKSGEWRYLNAKELTLLSGDRRDANALQTQE